MSVYKTILEETLEGWEDVRLGIVAEAKNIPEEKYDFRPVAEMRSVKELLVHILEVTMMMTVELTRPDGNFRRTPWPTLLKRYAEPAYQAQTKEELIGLLESQLETAQAQFREVGELFLLQFIQRFDGRNGTRLAWLQHGVAQEMYHRGQLTVYERLLGIEPALTKIIKGQ